MRTVISIVLFAFMLLAGVQAGSLNVKNSCNFDIYCLAARAATEANKAGETSSITKVSAGSTYTTNGDFVAANVSSAWKRSLTRQNFLKHPKVSLAT